MSFINQQISQFFQGVDHVVSAMDATQWGIFAAIMVTVGFMALRSRI